MHAIEFTSSSSRSSFLGSRDSTTEEAKFSPAYVFSYRSSLRASGARAITKSMRGINLARGFRDLSRLLALPYPSLWRKKTRARRVTPARPTIHDTKRRAVALFSERIPNIPDTESVSYFYKLHLCSEVRRREFVV